MIKNLINFMAQVILDFIVGMAIYFGLSAIFSAANNVAIVAIAVLVAVVFAEKFEVKLKK